MSELESYEMVTVDQGYHVYVVVWEAAVDQMYMYMYCLASEREATSMIPMPSALLRIMTHPLIMAPRAH